MFIPGVVGACENMCMVCDIIWFAAHGAFCTKGFRNLSWGYQSALDAKHVASGKPQHRTSGCETCGQLEGRVRGRV